MKKYITKGLAVLGVVLALATLLTVGAMATENTAPKLDIYAANLSFEDAVYLMYAVDAENVSADQVKMLFWTEPILQSDPEAYVKGTEAYEATSCGDVEIDGVTYTMFKYNKLYAYNMTDVIYARAYVEVEGEGYYSELSKYSILQYAYNKLGYTGTATDSTTLQTMLNNMLAYGASAQAHFEYKTDRLATAAYYEIQLVGGVMTDGATHGLYLEGEQVTITAPATDADGNAFVGWLDAAGNTVATTAAATLTVGTTNATYTASYTATPETPAYSEGLEFTLNDDGESYSVTGIGTCTDTDVIIPATYEGKPMTGIGENAFSNCDSLTSVTIPNSVTLIRNEAFYGCIHLASITISNSVTSIGSGAFSGCSNLENITVSPDNVIYHSTNNCLIETQSKTLIAGCKNSVIPTDGSVTSIGSSAFSGCSNLASITIPDGVTFIGYFAFSDCSSLTSITIPDSVTSIGDYAFKFCISLTSVTIGNGVTSIGDYAFSRCDNLTSITIPNSVTSIGNSAFKECMRLASVTIPSSVISIGNEAFYLCIDLASVTISDGVTTIGNFAFSRCNNLTSITIPNSVTSIGEGAFSDCSALANITVSTDNAVYHSTENCIIETASKTLIVGCKNSVIPTDGSVTTIGDGAFEGCGNLASITIPDGVTSIGDSAFFGCSNLTSIAIPDSVTSIGGATFRDCSSLASITIPDSVTTIGIFAFYGCSSLTSITIPDSVTSIGDRAFSRCSTLASVTIGGSVTTIGDYAFNECSSLASIIIPDSVTSIGYATFLCCTSLTSVTISDSVTAIDGGLFSGCTSLATVVIPDNVTSIGDGAFEACSSLASITIPDSVTTIGNYAFAWCTALISVTIPDSVTTIGESAFYDCSNLVTVYYIGTAEQWSNNVTIGGANAPLTSAIIYYYSETRPTEDGNYWHWVDGVPTAW